MLNAKQEESSGSLIVAGLGINLSQLTRECEQAIKEADVVFSLASNPVSEELVRRLNPNVQSLQHLYAQGKSRLDTYEQMVDCVVEAVISGMNVCFVAYGHPGVFAHPTHKAIQLVREKGYHAVMLPGVSAEDCMFADLGIDPAVHGCQSFEASDFVLRERIWDARSTLVLWQVPIAGITSLPEDGQIPPGFEFLMKRLIDAYGEEQMAILYEATPFPLCDARMDEVPLRDLKPELFHMHTTLVIKPAVRAPIKNQEFASAVK